MVCDLFLHLPPWQSHIPKTRNIANASLYTLLNLLSTMDLLLLINIIGLKILLSGASSLGQFVPTHVCSRMASPTPDGYIPNYSGFVSL